MKFKKTMRERYPRKTKKVILKYVTRSDYYEIVHFSERFAASQANFYSCVYRTPNDKLDAIVAELEEAAKSQPKNMTKEEEIAYIIGGTDVSSSLVESVNRCGDCDGFFHCSVGQFPSEPTDEACRWFGNEEAGDE